MKKIFLLLSVLLAFVAHAQLSLTNFNSAGMGGWIMINDSKVPSSTAFTASFVTRWQTSAFVKYRIATGDSALIAPGVFTPASSPDRWLISPSFMVNGANCFLLFDYLGNGDNTNTEELEILVASNAGTNKSDFNSVTTLSGNDLSKVMSANIGAYNGQTVRVAIRYKSANGFMVFIDNIRTAVFPSKDAALLNVSPNLSSPLAYGTIGKTISITGTVANAGAQSIANYTINYQEGTSPVVSQQMSPFFFSTLDVDQFTFNVPYTISSLGAKDIKVWVSVVGDSIKSNDTLKTKITGVAYMPKKKILFEQATGTWCGWCPRGHVFMDSFAEDLTKGTTIAVHNGDPMTVTDYDNGIKTVQGFSGYPGMSVDRVTVTDPSNMFSAYATNKDNFGFADIKRSIPTISGTNISTKITVRPATDLSGNYKVVFVVSEDKITGYDQTNYYSGSRDLIYKGVNWRNLPNPAPNIIYNHVARAIYPSYSGNATSTLPATMKAGEDYTIDISGSISPTWKQENLHYSVILLDGTTGRALNSINDTGYLVPKSTSSTYTDTFHNKVFKVATASSNSSEVYSKTLSLIEKRNYKWDIKKSTVVIPSGWKIETICDPKNCYTYKDNISDTFNGRPSDNKIYVGIGHNKIAGYGYCVVGLWETLDSAVSYKTYKYSLLASNSASIGLVSDASDKLLYYFDNKLFVDRDFRNATIEVYDLSGKVVMNSKVNSDHIDFNTTTGGIYIARVLVDGQVAKTHKFSTAK